MKITYLGTGAAEGIPALFCNCEYCSAVKKQGGKLMRSRAQVLFDGELSVDFPPDSFYHAASFGVDFSKIKYLLATHSHIDHFYAHDFILRGYKYAQNMSEPALDIFANEECKEVFCESVRREIRPEIQENIRFHTVHAFEKFQFGQWNALALKAKHTSKEPLLFALEKGGKRALHLCDTGALLKENEGYLQEFALKPFDLITFDCTFFLGQFSENARHMNLEENMRVLARLKSLGVADENTKCVLTHFSHNSAPSEKQLLRVEQEYGVICAYDGLTVEI